MMKLGDKFCLFLSLFDQMFGQAWEVACRLSSHAPMLLESSKYFILLYGVAFSFAWVFKERSCMSLKLVFLVSSLHYSIWPKLSSTLHISFSFEASLVIRIPLDLFPLVHI